MGHADGGENLIAQRVQQILMVARRQLCQLLRVNIRVQPLVMLGQIRNGLGIDAALIDSFHHLRHFFVVAADLHGGIM